jgi:transposase
MTEATPAVRYRAIDRSRVSSASLDEQLPQDHPVRALWDFTCRLDLSGFIRPAKAVVGGPGAAVITPQLLFALWLWAIIDGTGSARRLAHLCTRDLPYQWLTGGDPVNYHTLSDFYSANGQALRGLFVEHIAALRLEGLIQLRRLALDGRKVIANASKDSFRREPTLQQHLREAQQHLDEALTQQDDPALPARQRQARRRGAQDRKGRLERAVQQVRHRQQQRAATGRAKAQPEEARAAETDPDAAKMKMPDGGYRLAYNVETVSECDKGLIVTVAVTSQGSDNGQLEPMVSQVEAQQAKPEQVLADSGFSDEDDVEALEGRKVEVLMPPKNEKKEKEQGQDPYARKRRDSDAVAGWRERMGTAEAQQAYKRRAPVAEGVHAQQANKGWRRFRLRGLAKVTTEAYWQALGHNLARLLALGVALAGTVRAA